MWCQVDHWEVEAPPEKVWEALTDSSWWPQWMAGIAEVQPRGPVEAGAHLMLRCKRIIPIMDRIEITEVVAEERFAYRRFVPGMIAEIVWELAPAPGNNATKVTRRVQTSGLADSLLGWIPGFRPREGAQRESQRRFMDSISGQPNLQTADSSPDRKQIPPVKQRALAVLVLSIIFIEGVLLVGAGAWIAYSLGPGGASEVGRWLGIITVPRIGLVVAVVGAVHVLYAGNLLVDIYRPLLT